MNNMFDTLTQRMTRIVKTLRGEARLTESNMQQMLREVRLALLEADVALPVVGGADEGQASELRLTVAPPAIILMAGLQGAGKTTTVGKLAKRLREQKK